MTLQKACLDEQAYIKVYINVKYTQCLILCIINLVFMWFKKKRISHQHLATIRHILTQILNFNGEAYLPNQNNFIKGNKTFSFAVKL